MAGKSITARNWYKTEVSIRKFCYNKLLISVAELAVRFRPNIVIDTQAKFIEEKWKRLRIGNEEFTVDGKCTRCGAICTDPSTGTRQNELLKVLTKPWFSIRIKI